MSKDLVFESDKLENKKKIRRILIPVAALVLILTVAVIIAVILGKNKPVVYNGGENTPYPYSWTENKDGSLIFYLPKSQTEGYDWTAASSVPDVVKAEAYGKAPENMSAYTITPLAFGRTLFRFNLQNTASDTADEDQIYSLELIMDVLQENEQLRTVIVSGGSRSLPGVVKGGEAEGYPYQIALSGDRRTLVISLHDGSPAREQEYIDSVTAPLPSGFEDMTLPETSPAENASIIVIEGNNRWKCFSSAEEVASVDGVHTDGRQVGAQLTIGMEAGRSEIRLFCDSIGRALVFTLESGEDYSVTVSSDRIESYEPVQPTTYEEDAEIGIITLPADEQKP